jgi:hypothetical protein
MVDGSVLFEEQFLLLANVGIAIMHWRCVYLFLRPLKVSGNICPSSLNNNQQRRLLYLWILYDLTLNRGYVLKQC